jgi:hypothetical protein
MAEVTRKILPESAAHGETPQAYNFNPDPEWQRYILRFEPVIVAIALKRCSSDEDMRDDVMQEARIALATTYPEQVKGFEAYCRGEITESQWHEALDRYCRNVVRNSILSFLDSYATGPWNMGRTRHVRDRKTGQSRKVYLPPRFSSLDELVDDYGMQVDETGAISWPDPSDDGLPSRRNLSNAE